MGRVSACIAVWMDGLNAAQIVLFNLGAFSVMFVMEEEWVAILGEQASVGIVILGESCHTSISLHQSLMLCICCSTSKGKRTI